MIRVRHLLKAYSSAGGRVRAVDDFSFDVPTGSFCTLLGPSGCGKSTTLRSVAGLERPDRGEIHIGDSLVYSQASGVYVPTNKRAIGMVFQSYAIWPHMTVADNVSYALRSRRGGRGKDDRHTVRQRVLGALTTVGLEGLGDRPAPLLSGGQQQRVALARAIVAEPEVLLLDEPLSNLDAALRTNMRVELKSLQARLGITTLYVTHDQQEALAMSDTVIVMRDGKALQVGSPEEIYHQPANRQTAEFIGTINLISARLGEPVIAARGNRVQTAFGVLAVDGKHQTGTSVGGELSVCIRPEAIDLLERHGNAGPADVPAENTFSGRIEQAVFLGQQVDYVVRVGPTALKVQTPSTQRLAEGLDVTVRLPREYCTLLLESVKGNPAVARGGAEELMDSTHGP